MKEKNSVRSKWLTIRLSPEEEKSVAKLSDRTTSASLSEYARNVLLQEPVLVIYRSQSADDFLSEMLLLKRELNAIGNNFNQAVHLLHTLDHDRQVKAWAERYESQLHTFQAKTEEILHKLQQIYRQWSQK